MTSARRGTFDGGIAEAFRPFLDWNMLIGYVALGSGVVAGGRAVRGHGSDEIVFGLAAVLLLTVAGVAVTRVLRTAESEYPALYLGMSFASGINDTHVFVTQRFSLSPLSPASPLSSRLPSVRSLRELERQ